MSYIIFRSMYTHTHTIALTQNPLTKLCQSGLNIDIYFLFILDLRNIPLSLKRFKISSPSSMTKYNVVNNQKVIYI